MPAIDLYRDEQITVAQQAIYQISHMFMVPVEEGWAPRDGDVRSEIRFVNRWNGVFLLECSRALAAAFSSLMLSLEIDDVSDDDRKDVVGELLNTIAGNLKCLLPGETELSIPVTSIVSGEADRGCVSGDEFVERSEVILDGGSGMLRLSLIHCV